MTYRDRSVEEHDGKQAGQTKHSIKEDHSSVKEGPDNMGWLVYHWKMTAIPFDMIPYTRENGQHS